MSELLNLPQMARHLGVTSKWLKESADVGRVPCLKAGTRYLFDLEAVKATLAKEAAQSRQGGYHDR